MADGFPPSGRLFSNNKKTSPKAPDVTGKLEISKELLDYLVKCSNKGQPIAMDLAGWRKQSRSTSGSWYSLAASLPYAARLEDSGAPVARSTVDTFDDEIPF